MFRRINILVAFFSYRIISRWKHTKTLRFVHWHNVFFDIVIVILFCIESDASFFVQSRFQLGRTREFEATIPRRVINNTWTRPEQQQTWSRRFLRRRIPFRKGIIIGGLVRRVKITKRSREKTAYRICIIHARFQIARGRNRPSRPRQRRFIIRSRKCPSCAGLPTGPQLVCGKPTEDESNRAWTKRV